MPAGPAQAAGSGVRVSAQPFPGAGCSEGVSQPFIAGCQTAAALFHSRRIHTPPPPPRKPALPKQPSECLLTHPEKASIMARRLPPSQEFRGAGPVGR